MGFVRSTGLVALLSTYSFDDEPASRRDQSRARQIVNDVVRNAMQDADARSFCSLVVSSRL